MSIQQPSCGDAVGVCKAPLGRGYGYESLSAAVTPEPDFATSPLEFGYPIGSGPFEFMFADNPYVTSRYLEVQLQRPQVISALDIQTTRTNYLKSFKLWFNFWHTMGFDADHVMPYITDENGNDFIVSFFFFFFQILIS